MELGASVVKLVALELTGRADVADGFFDGFLKSIAGSQDLG